MLCTNFDIIPLPDSDAPAVAYSVTMIFPLAFAFSCASDFRNLGADCKHFRNYSISLVFKICIYFCAIWQILVLAGSPFAQIESAVDEFQHFRCTKKLVKCHQTKLDFYDLTKAVSVWTEERRMFELEILHLFFILTSFPGPSIMKEVRIDKPSNQWLAVWLGWSQIPTGPLYMTWLTSDISQFGKFPSMRPTESASLLFWKSLAKCSLMIEYFFCFYEFTMQSLYIHNTKFGSAVLELAKDLRGLLNYWIWQYQLWSFKSWDTKLLRE